MTTTVNGRVQVTASPQRALIVPQGVGTIIVRLWVTNWYNRAAQNIPVYFSYRKETCRAGEATVLPMDSTVFSLQLDPGTELWVVGEDNCLLNYAVDPLVPGLVL